MRGREEYMDILLGENLFKNLLDYLYMEREYGSLYGI